MRRIAACLALSLLAACSLLSGQGRGPIIGPAGARLSEAQLTRRLDAADVVILGEIHDNPVHHARQARLVRALKPNALAFEMVPTGSEEGIQVFLAQGGSRAEIGPAIGWKRLGWPDWKLYAPIFEAAPDAYIAGGGPAHSELRRAALRGAGAAWGAGADRVGLATPLDRAVRRKREDQMIAAHCGKIPRLVARELVEAQRFTDARLARATLRARKRGGGQVVLITGDGHARTDRGVPTYLRRLAPGLKVVSVGMIELPAGADPALAWRGLPYDYVWFSRPARRPDLCTQLN